MKSGGIFIMAIPGVMHLYDLKKVIYDTPYKNTVEDTHLEGFELLSDEPLTYQMQLDTREAVKNLFMMTPYAYRTGAEGRGRVESLDGISCTADFRIFVYRRI